MPRFPTVVPAFIAVFATSAASAATLPPQMAAYSATAIYDIDDNHYNSTLVSDHGRERRIVQTPYGAQTVIIDPSRNKGYLLQPPVGAFALDLSSAKIGVNLAQLYTAEAEPVGQETIDGMKVTKYHLTASPAQNMSFTGYVWSTADGIFVKVDGAGVYRGRSSHIAMRLADVKRGPQDPSALALPPGTNVIDAAPLVKQFLQ